MAVAKRDGARLDRLNAALDKAANTDELTGLGNRLALVSALGVVRSRIERHGDIYAVLILDLDRFKAINDELGHLHGDEVLRAASQAVTSGLRSGDRAYRYGGEEFVILARVSAPAEARDLADRSRHSIRALGIRNAGNVPHRFLTGSIGAVSVGPSDLRMDAEGWLARADAALYCAKRNGRNRTEMVSAPAAA